MVNVADNRYLRIGRFVAAALDLGVALLIPALKTTQIPWTVYAAWVWALIGVVILISQRWPEIVVWAIRGIGPALSVACIAQRAIGRVTWPYNENATASMLLLLLPWWWGKNWMVVAILVAGLIATGSAGAMLALAVAVALLIAKSFSRSSRAPFWAYALIIIGLAIIGGVVIAALQPATSQARLDHWKVALYLFEQRPLFGFGPGTYPSASTINDQNHADNLMLTVMVEMGAVGWAFVFAVIFETVSKIFDTSGNPARMALLAWLLHNLVDCTPYFPLVAALFAANLALLWRWPGVITSKNTGSGATSAVRSVGEVHGGVADSI